MYGSSRRVAASEPATAFGAMRAFLRLSASFAACAFWASPPTRPCCARRVLRCSESGPVEDAGVATELSAPAATEESTARDLAARRGDPRTPAMGISESVFGEQANLRSKRGSRLAAASKSNARSVAARFRRLDRVLGGRLRLHLAASDAAQRQNPRIIALEL